MVNRNGMVASILNYGGIIARLLVPDKQGNLENIVLGYKNLADYKNDSNYFGAIIGRVAGRIQEASFQLGANCYQLEENEGHHHLHSASVGFHQVIWDAQTFQSEDRIGVQLQHVSPNGEGGYPGNVTVRVTYTLNNYNQLSVHYSAVSDKLTVLTLTNHSYFNLSGNLKDTILNHRITIKSHHILELDKASIPTGRKLPVKGTPFDFCQGRLLQDGILHGNEQNKRVGNGYDHYFLFDCSKQKQVLLSEEASGRTMQMETDQPGMVMYTANNLAGGHPLHEGVSRKYMGVCLETQASPVSLHHNGFPSITLQPNQYYDKKTTFSFSW